MAGLKTKSRIGSSPVRVEDSRFLRGRGRYVDDLALEGMVYASILRSPVAHARIRDIDTADALSAPGVVRCFTFRDIGISKPIPMRVPPLPGLDRFLQLPLASEKARYVGEPLALVLAESPYLAEDALDRIHVDLEELPAVVDRQSAEGPSHVHEKIGTNVATRYDVSRGDVDLAFREADYTRREIFRCHRHSAVPMETRGLVAAWDNIRKKLTMWGAAKVPFPNRRILAHLLEVPESAIDLIEVDVGGGFGIRGEFYPEDFLVPCAARLIGRPVKWIEDRREHLIASNHSREVECELEIACRRDGTILGLRGCVSVDMGAYVRTNGSVVPSKVAEFLPGPYHIAHYSCEVTAFVTNKTPVGSYRGPGRFEANFFRERLIDIAARDLGIEPTEIRRRNLLRRSDLPYKTGCLVPGAAESTYDGGDCQATFDRALKEIRWEELRSIQGHQIGGWYHGIGLASFVESGGAGPKENARIRLEPDGCISVFIGCSALGQGHETTFAQVCSDALGVPLDRVRVFHGSTTYLDEGFGTYAGRSAVMGGSAILDGAKRLIECLEPLAAECLGRPNAEIVWQGGGFCTADGRRQIALAEMAAIAAERGATIEALGSFSSADVTYSYGTSAAHVAVDPHTGRVKVIDYVSVEDVGRMINPAIVHGQMIGAIVQGLGATFLDEFLYDSDGQLLNASLADYLLPTAPDFPCVRSVSLEIVPSTRNPLGVKAAGEGGIVPVAATIGNAVSAALSSFNVQANTLPLTPARVWAAVQGV